MDKQPKKKQPGKWRALMSIAAAQFIDFGEGGVLSSMFPLIRKSLGLDVGHLGAITAAKRVVGTVFTPIWGMAADRFSRKTVLVWATGVWGIWTLLIGFAASYEYLLILSIIAGIGLVALQSPLNSLISDLFKEEERGKAFGILRTISFIGTVVSILLLGVLGKSMPDLGWRIGFWSFGGLSILSGLLIWAFVDEPVRGQTEAAVVDVAEVIGKKMDAQYAFELKKVPQIFQVRSMLVMLLEYIPNTLLFSTLLTFMVTWLVDDRGFEPGTATITMAVLVVGMAIGTTSGGLIGDWADLRNPQYGRLVVGHVALVAVAVLAYLLFQVEWSGQIGYWTLIFLLGLFVDIRYSAAIAPVTSSVLLPEIRTTGFAVVQTAYAVVTAVSAYLAGRLGVELGLTGAVFWTANLACLANVAVWFLFYFTYGRDSENLQRILAERRKKQSSDTNSQ
ncbi:MAG: MFS transporter [Proteobacteria bacterium]|nr:MFS transporter [Pseudomonadota bacterium]